MSEEMSERTFTVDELRQLAHRHRLLTRAVDMLRRKLDQEEMLCNSALHELALERGEKNPARFILIWRRERLHDTREILK